MRPGIGPLGVSYGIRVHGGSRWIYVTDLVDGTLR